MHFLIETNVQCWLKLCFEQPQVWNHRNAYTKTHKHSGGSRISPMGDAKPKGAPTYYLAKFY